MEIIEDEVMGCSKRCPHCGYEEERKFSGTVNLKPGLSKPTLMPG